MATPLALDSQRIGLQLHALLLEVDPARWQHEAAEAAQKQLDAMRLALHEVTLCGAAALEDQLMRLTRVVETAASAPDGMDVTARWQAFRDQAEPVYGELSEALRAYDIHLPMLRPTNYLRNVQHIGSAVAILLLLHYALPTAGWRMGLAGGAFAFAVFLESGRRAYPPMNAFLMSLLGRIAHPHEAHRVNSSTWFITALFVLSFFDLVYGTVAVAILGLADPAAAVIGRRFGRVTLVHGRTLEGTLTFWAVGTAVSVACLLLWFDYGTSQAVWMGAAAALFAAVAELFSRRIDDNLAIPVAAAIGLWLVL